MKYQAVVVMNHKGVIGKDGYVPYNLPYDLTQLRRITSYTPCVMGRKTYEEISSSREKYPLRRIETGRRLMVLTSNASAYNNLPELCFVESYEECKDLLKTYTKTKPNKGTDWRTVTIWGGASIYDQFYDDLDSIWLTIANQNVENPDTFFPRKLRIGEQWEIDRYPISRPGESCNCEFYRMKRK